MPSKRRYKSFTKKRNNLYEEDKKYNIELDSINFKTQKINKTFLDNYLYKENQNNSTNISNIIKNKKMISTPFLYNDEENKTIDNDNIILNYNINKIKQEINNIKEKNEILLKKLSKEKERNIILKTNKEKINENDIEQTLLEISKYFEVDNLEEIPNKLNEMINYLSSNNNTNEISTRNEFISNLKEIYKKANNINDKNNIINIKTLWRWIKYLINTNKKIKNEIDKNKVLLQNIEKKSVFYKKHCEEIMNIYDIKSIKQFDAFVHELINNKNIYKKRIEQLKKMLSEDEKNK